MTREERDNALNEISQVVKAFLEAQRRIKPETKYAVVMYADTYHFFRCHALSARFADSLKWLRRDVQTIIKVSGFVRVPYPVYHGSYR